MDEYEKSREKGAISSVGESKGSSLTVYTAGVVDVLAANECVSSPLRGSCPASTLPQLRRRVTRSEVSRDGEGLGGAEAIPAGVPVKSMAEEDELRGITGC